VKKKIIVSIIIILLMYISFIICAKSQAEDTLNAMQSTPENSTVNADMDILYLQNPGCEFTMSQCITFLIYY